MYNNVMLTEGRQRPIIVTHTLCADQPQVYQTRMSCIDTVFWTLHSQVLGQGIITRKA